jgi:mannose-6-phosphate isomerase-like protein (cupin superfamily)
MAGEHLTAQARRVVTGVDADGRSCFESDGPTPTRLAQAGNTKCDIWRVDGLPASVRDGDGLSGGVETQPPTGGLVYRVVSFPPDSEWDKSLGYADAKGPLAGSIPEEESGGIAGLHMTDTVDICTVISGEMHAVMETGETVLRPGDTLVQRGTKHTWSNRGDRPVVMAVVMISAE